MEKIIAICLTIVLCLSIMTNCDNTQNKDSNTINGVECIAIQLSDNKILVNDKEISENPKSGVYAAHDIVYYEDGKDFTYGAGNAEDSHSKEEADKHIVVHITKAGSYVLSGKLSAGQIVIDLGKDSKADPTAVVNLYLNGVDITNTVAPAIIFYNVYEPFYDVSEETATRNVDTAMAGANIYIVDDTENNLYGSYVARIYKPESVVLNETGTEVVEQKKLHKYDGALHSKRTLNINGDTNDTGILNIIAENEGISAEMHLTINGGIVNINSNDDGINANEDNVSVVTINNGFVSIASNGINCEGDGIDSNGWLVINGGTLCTSASGNSPDSGIDSSMGTYINGGTIISSGRVKDEVTESTHNFAIFNFYSNQKSGCYRLKDSNGKVVATYNANNSFKYLLFALPELAEGEYTLWGENGKYFSDEITDDKEYTFVIRNGENLFSHLELEELETKQHKTLIE